MAKIAERKRVQSSPEKHMTSVKLPGSVFCFQKGKPPSRRPITAAPQTPCERQGGTARRRDLGWAAPQPPGSRHGEGRVSPCSRRGPTRCRAELESPAQRQRAQQRNALRTAGAADGLPRPTPRGRALRRQGGTGTAALTSPARHPGRRVRRAETRGSGRRRSLGAAMVTVPCPAPPLPGRSPRTCWGPGAAARPPAMEDPCRNGGLPAPRLTETRPPRPPLPRRPPLTAPAPHRRTQGTPSFFPPRCGLGRPLRSEQGHPGHDTPAAAIARSRSQWRGPGTPSPRRVTRCVAGATARRTPYSSGLDQERGTRHLAMGCPPMGHRAPLPVFPDWAAGCGSFTYADRPTAAPSRAAGAGTGPLPTGAPAPRCLPACRRAVPGKAPLESSYCRGASRVHADADPLPGWALPTH